MDPIDLDPIAFRNSVLRHLELDDDAGLRLDAAAVMAPIFVEKFIDEIAEDNPWNDVLFLMAKRLMEVSADLRHMSDLLQAKKVCVNHPEAKLKDLVVIEPDGTLRLRS